VAARGARLLRVGAGLALAGPLAAAPGDALGAVRDLVVGPVLYLVAACGCLFALYCWARGEKRALLFSLGGLIFLAFVRQAVVQWLGASSGLSGISLGEFPVYGQTPGVQVPGEVNTYQDIRAWGYLGLMYCNLISTFLLSHGVPVVIAVAGGLVTYWRITVQHHAGSVVAYLLGVILVTAFAVVPSVYFAPQDEAAVLGNDAIKAINTFAAVQIGTSSSSSSSTPLLVPVLPALILLGGVDLTEGIGMVLNAHPVQGYAAQLLRAARTAQLPEQWLPQYQDFAAHCAAAEKGFVEAENNPRAYDPQVDYAKAMFQALQGHQVNGASANALSSWGDNLLAFIPVHGYAFAQAQDLDLFHHPAALTPTQQAALTQSLAHMAFLSPELSGPEKAAALADWSRIRSGDPGAQGFATLPAIGAGADPSQYQWQLPFNAMLALGGVHPWDDATFSPDTGTIQVPYCSVPLDGSGQPLGAFSVTVDQTLGASAAAISGFWSSAVADDQDGSAPFTLTDDSQYLRDIASSTVANASGGAITIAPLDWGDQLRDSLVGTYRAESCLSACGDTDHKSAWGCLVSGQFIGLAASHPECQQDADLTTVFYGGTVAGQNYSVTDASGASGSYAAMIEANLYHRYPAKPRTAADVQALASDVLAGATALGGSGTPTLANPGADERVMVDLILSAPGTYSQNPLATDPYTMPSEPVGSAPSFWHVLSELPKAALWLVQTFVALAETLISWIWPHFMGIVLVLFLALYPLFALLALWPGRWRILTDWCRALMWVLLWAPLVSLGYSFKNAGAVLTQGSGFGSALPLPGHTILALIGCCIVIMAPPIANAVLAPCYATLARMGAVVYGTGFRLLGTAAEIGLAATVVGLAAGAGAAGGAGALAGGGATRGGISAGGGAGSGGGGGGGGRPGGPARGAAAAVAAGGSASPAPGGALARARRWAQHGAGYAQPLWSAGSQALSLGMEVTDRAGLGLGVEGAGGGFGSSGHLARLAPQVLPGPPGAAGGAARFGPGGDAGGRGAPAPAAGAHPAADGASPAARSHAVGRGLTRSAAEPAAQQPLSPGTRGLLQRQERLQDALAQGQSAEIEHRAVDLSTFAALTAQDALRDGALGEALEALHVQTDCEALRAARALALAPGAPSTAVALERLGASRDAALELVPQALAQAQASGDGEQCAAARRSRADLVAGAAQTAYRSLAATSAGTGTGAGSEAWLEAQAMATQAMAGYAEAQAPLCAALRAGAGSAQDHAPDQLRRLVRLGAGVSALAAQAQDLQRSSGGAVALPESLSDDAVRMELSTARSASGPVGRALLSAIDAAAQGDAGRSGSQLQEAARAAELSARATPGAASVLVVFAQELRATAAALQAARGTDLTHQTPFLQGSAELPPLGGRLPGLRHLCAPDA